MLRSWAQSIRDQCRTGGVAYLHKQNGEWIDADEWNAILGYPWTYPSAPLLNFTDAADLAKHSGGYRYEHHSDGTTLIRVGREAAGALLDGREWQEFPV